MMQLTTLDLISAVMHRPRRRLDFAIILHLSRVPDSAALEAGALSARREFPSTAAVLHDKQWQPSDVPGILFITSTEGDHAGLISQFVNSWWDIRATPSVQQLVLVPRNAGGAMLVTRFHHAATDGLGALLWLQHQLEVANGSRAARKDVATYEPPLLQQHKSPQGRSAFAFRGPADRLRVARGASGMRRWRTIAIGMAPLQEAVTRGGDDSTYNDLLATCALETFRLWNHSERIGLWFPINIRQNAGDGFGNGSSRIRVYNRYAPSASLHEKSKVVREQIDWSREHGEWAVPNLPWLMKLPESVLRPLLRLYFNRPWVDMGTGTFSHVQRSPLDAPVFDGVMKIDIVGMLDKRHALGLFAMSRAGTTFLTFVYDPARLDNEAVTRLIGIYQGQLASAR